MDPELDATVPPVHYSAAADTYQIVWYDFEQMNWQSWARHDNTAQIAIWVHVDTFNPGECACPVEGSKAWWCGTRGNPADLYLCSWDCPPGYGNAWNQMLQIDAFEFTGAVTFSYCGYFDSEPDYDQTVVEYDAGGNNWVEMPEGATYDGALCTIAVHTIPLTTVKTKLRFHFVSDGAWSDQDGLWCTDGAFIVDSLVVDDEDVDPNPIDYEDCELAPVGATTSDGDLNGIFWNGMVETPFGMYSGVYTNLGDKDPCGDNFGTQVVFFVGSIYPSSDYPGLFDTPFCASPSRLEAPCQDEIIYSPVIDMTKYSPPRTATNNLPIDPGDLPDLGGAYLRFTVYRDLPVGNLVFYVWAVRNIDEFGCPGQWQDRNYVYYGPDQDYIFVTQDVSDLVGDEPMQIQIGCVDMCDAWYGVYGNCAAHTPSPWFDNVRMYRFKALGPQWSHRDLDIFQDNFPEDEFDIESFVRADAANDLRPNDDPVIDPGDSAVVDCTSMMGGGIRYSFLGPDSLPEVEFHVRVTSKGCDDPMKEPIYGPILQGTYGKYQSDDGHWTIIRCEEARTGAGNVAADKYMVDLNDSLFTRGYKIEFYWKAYDNAGYSTTLPRYAEDRCVYFEFTCLPTLCHDILFVDDFHGRGTLRGNVEQYWNPAFAAVLPGGGPACAWPTPCGTIVSPNCFVDRYDVNNPSSLVGNGPGSRAKVNQMVLAYNKVIWDSGNLESGTICDGLAPRSGKSPDCQLLRDWIDFNTDDCGLWVCGDDVAEDLAASTVDCALELMSVKMGVSFVNGSYYGLTGIVSPKAKGLAPGPHYHVELEPPEDSLCIFGGCPIINQFDVLEATGGGWPALEYGDCLCEDVWLPSGMYAAIADTYTTASGHQLRGMWYGFSFMYVRDCEPIPAPIIRNHLMADVFNFWAVGINPNIVPTPMPEFRYTLAQNFPNPFNPKTRIQFSMKEKGLVTLKVYNVAGQLVRTLVNEVRDAGPHEILWHGDNDRGSSVASGVYFYKMDTKQFSQTKKMVLLR
jgi:hypothetical protein